MDKEKILHYNILNSINVKIKVQCNSYDIPANVLFEMAARKNPKRSFLFVSKILGKHIPVSPQISLLAGAALGAIYTEKVCKQKVPQIKEIVSAIKDENKGSNIYDEIMRRPMELVEPTLFIGFAETATALGHSVFKCFQKDSFYIHTTREVIIENKDLITFEEEHSHATSHRIYPLDFPILKSKAPIVLVDDEITTGKTALNIIKAIHRIYPRKKYTILTLLDWRTESDKMEFEKLKSKLKVEINVLSLLSGIIDVTGKTLDDININELKASEVDNSVNVNYINLDSFFDEKVDYPSLSYLKYTGRFGTSIEEDRVLEDQIREAGKFLRGYREKGKILCLGTGEFMYIPMRIASHMGENVLFHSTTRSPIYPQNISRYGIKNAFSYPNPEDYKIVNYFYNIPYSYYDELYLFFENEIDKEKIKPMLCQLKGLGIKKINILACSTNKKGGVQNV